MKQPDIEETSIELPIIGESSDNFDERDWFFLFWIAYFNHLKKGNVNTPELVEKLHISQQTISRRIIHLEKKGYITRIMHKDGGELTLTAKAMEKLNKIDKTLKAVLEPREIFNSKLFSGMGEGAYYISTPFYLEQFTQKLGFKPFFGTFNLAMESQDFEAFQHELNRFTPVEIQGFSNGNRTYGNVYCYRAEIWAKNYEEKKALCAILKIQRTSHKPNVLEVIAEQCLRDFFKVKDNDQIQFRLLSTA